jgi:hypothetical protein
MKQTAVEWLYDQIENKGKSIYEILEQAKAMEKEQIVDAYWKGVETELYERPFRTSEQYYNETFKSE